MRNLSVATLLGCCFLVSSVAGAQESLIGKYTGSYASTTRNGNTIQRGVELTIVSVDNGVVKGTAEVTRRGSCSGAYPMEGKLEGKTLVMRSTEKGGSASDCSFRLKATHEGNKLVGTVGQGSALELSK